MAPLVYHTGGYVLWHQLQNALVVGKQELAKKT